MSEPIQHVPRLFSMKEAAQMSELSEHTIRNYLRDFNIQTQETEGGHRRFTPESITLLKKAKSLKDEQGLSIPQIRAFFNGEVTEHHLKNDPDLRSNLEKQIEQLTEQVQNLTDTVDKFPEILKLSLEMQSRIMLEQQETREKQLLIDFQQQTQQLLLEQKTEAEKPKEGFFKRLFN